jgi:hypothetical protein
MQHLIILTTSFGIFYQPQMAEDDECGEIGAMSGGKS